MNDDLTKYPCPKCDHPNVWKFMEPICPKCGTDIRDGIKCELCNGYVPCERCGEGNCEKCGQFYQYEEGIFIELTDEQRKLLKEFNLKQNKPHD